MAKTDLSKFTYEELQEAIEAKKGAEITAVKEEIKTAKNALAELEFKLSKLTGKEISSSGRSSGVTEKVLAYLQEHKKGTPDEVAKALGLKKLSVGQALNNMKKAGTVTKETGHGTPYILKK
jgi:transcription initiation factor IIE alpha subunit